MTDERKSQSPLLVAYQAWRDRIVRHLVALYNVPEDIGQDIVQDAYLRCAGVERIHSPARLLRQTARNLAVNYLHRQREDGVGDRIDELGPAESPSDDLGPPELYDALNDLSPYHHTVIELRYLCEMTQAEVARLLGVEQPAITVAEQRALRHLRESMGVES